MKTKNGTFISQRSSNWYKIWGSTSIRLHLVKSSYVYMFSWLLLQYKTYRISVVFSFFFSDSSCNVKVVLIGVLVSAPEVRGIWLKIFVLLLEMPLIGSAILTYLKKQNKIQEVSSLSHGFGFPSFRTMFCYLDLCLCYADVKGDYDTRTTNVSTRVPSSRF